MNKSYSLLTLSLATVNALVLGGLAALLLVRLMLLTTFSRLVSASGQAEILNVLDKLLPYLAACVGAALLLGGVTASAWLWTRPRWRWMAAATLAVPLVLMAVFGLSRVRW